MAEIKWIKITTDMFDDEKIALIETMPEHDTLIIIWVKLICLAGKINAGGIVHMTERMAYTEEQLAAVLRRPVNSVRLAIRTFQQFEMIEVGTDGRIALVNWEKHQNIDGLERIREITRQRVQRFRIKQKQLQLGDGNVTVASSNDADKIRIDKIRIDKRVQGEWQKTLEIIKERTSLPNFKTWFEQTRGVGADGDIYLIEVPSAFCQEYLAANQQSLIDAALIEATGNPQARAIFEVPEDQDVSAQ